MKKSTKECIKISGYIHSFLNIYAPSHKTGSEHTLRSYEDALALYMSFLETEKKVRSGDLGSSCFRRTVIEEWLEWLKDTRKCSPQSCNNRLASIRTFLKYLGGQDVSYLAIYHEATDIPRMKCGKKQVKGISREAAKALMEAPDVSTRTGRRDTALIILLYSTAARLDEVLGMKNSQLHLSAVKPYATIVGKGDKVRTLYLLPKVVAHLERYQKEFHGILPDPEAYVFFSRNTGTHGKMTQPAVARILKKHARTAHGICQDVPLGLHAHQLRHAKASHWLEDGMNILQISFLLGHEQLQTTMKYLDITTEDEAKAIATLESETDKSVSPKWKNPDGSLIDFCGIRRKG